MANNQDVRDSLIGAVHDGNEEIVRELINTYGLSYLDPRSKGYQLLCEALRRKHRIIANILLNHGCKVNNNNNRRRRKRTPLHLAVENDLIEAVNMLLNKGAHIEVKTASGWTPLHYAALYGHYEVMELLLKHKADVNFKDKDGWTPLYYAAYNKHYEVIELLLIHKADANGFDTNQTRSYVKATLKRCIVKLKTANLYDNEVNLPFMDDEINDFRNKCKEEIIKMKNMKVKNTNITFYDILTKLNKNTTWMRNENVVESLKTENYKVEFPMYAKLIAYQIKRSMKRNQLLEQSFEVCRSIFNNLIRKLPDECVEKVLNYLSNEDLEILVPSSKVLCS